MTPKGILDWLVVVIPPTTLITALAFYFGLAYTTARTSYLGIEVSTLGFSTTDYVLRSPEAVLVPAGVVLTAMLAGIAVHALILFLITKRRWSALIRTCALSLAIFGTLALVAAVRAMFVPISRDVHYLLPPVLLGIGAMGTGYGYYVYKLATARQGSAPDSAPPWERMGYVIVSALVILGLFWGTSLYAGALGKGRAQTLERDFTDRPSAIVYSKYSLALSDPVTETVLDTAASEFRYRYSGLRLLLRSGGKYFLFPDDWKHGKDSAIVLADDTSIRVEFKSGGQ